MDEDRNGDIYADHQQDQDISSFGEPGGIEPVFTGTAKEYFKIWIVNVVLTIITLGFYTPWAKVRTRRYFYLNTQVGGDPCDYLADPRKLLYGYLILTVFLLGYNYLPTINPVLIFPVMLVGAVGLPWVVYKSRRFFCRNSSYRNIRFRFTGTLGDSYAAYLGMPILGALSFGFAMPYAIFRQKEYFFKHVSYGGKQSEFTGKPGYFFKVYYLMGVLFAGAMIVLTMVIASTVDSSAAQGGPSRDMAIIIPLVFFYLVVFTGGFIAHALVTNYCWNNTEFPGYSRFICRIHPVRFAWIQISNAIVSIFSLGLLLPWAMVRMARYRLGCMTVELYPAIEELVAEPIDQDDGAFGDLAADQFDFEIGL